MNTNGIVNGKLGDCSGNPFNFQPEGYHRPFSFGHGPYENTTGADGPTDPSNPETSDAECYPADDTHGVLNIAPDTITRGHLRRR
jgi:hypothetical protein